MIRPRKIFKAGGFNGPDLDPNPQVHPPAVARTEFLDLLGGDVPWTAKASMNYARVDFNLVLGPDGNAYALGGSTTHDVPATAINPIEIYNYATNTWTIGPSLSASEFRGYHSIAG
ncbi:MAG: kelch repeat-containing protein, partial [Fimbriimonadales bacterium]